MIRHLLLILAMALAGAIGAQARTAAEFFSAAPDTVFPLLPQSTRLDMLDYFRFGSTRASDNKLGGKARVTAETDAVLDLCMTDSSTTQVAVMLAGNDTVVAVATTLLTPLPDTNVRFYRSDWSPARLALPEPAYNEWLTAKGRADMVRTRELLPFMLVEARIAHDASSVTLSNAAVRYVAAELRDEAAATVVPEMKFVLTGNKFVRQ